MDQLAIMVTGCLSIWLVNDQRAEWRKWASVVGLIGQPVWFYVTWTTDQWGVFALTVVYTAAWCRGFHEHWIRGPKEDTVSVKEGGSGIAAALPSPARNSGF